MRERTASDERVSIGGRAAVELGTVVRPRLVEVLRGRFERRLTVITAGAGFGKSTLLRQAVQENRIERAGRDVWIRLDTRARDASRLRADLAEALGGDPRRSDLDELVDAAWRAAPASVALLFDDTHVLDGAASAWAVIEALVDRFPANAHLVLSGRTPPSLPSAQLAQADVIAEADLAFTPAEIQTFARRRGIPPEVRDALPSWPALATLTSQVGSGASIDYLWEQVLTSLPSWRRTLLAALVPFGALDDELVRAVADELLDTDDDLLGPEGDAVRRVVGELPLVERTAPGGVRFHDLWVDALDQAITSTDRRRALQAGAALLLERGDHLRAAEAFARASDDDGVREVVLAYAHTPNLEADQRDVERLDSLLSASLRATPVGRYVEAARYEVSDEHRAMALYQRAADEARVAGDLDVETVATWRVIQYLDHDSHTGPAMVGRLADLVARDVPTARGVLAFVESRRAQLDGDAARSRALLSGLDDFTPAQRATSSAIRLIDLGLPEEIPATLDQVVASGLSSIFDAQAVWLQGHADAALAWEIARPLIERGSLLPVTTRVSLNSVLVTIAVAAGAHEEVRPLLEETRRFARGTPEMVVLLTDAASVLMDLVTEGEDVALGRLGRMLRQVPLGRWPERPYLYVLSVIRGLVPGSEMLDRCAFGPSFTEAVRAGAALAAMRAGDTTPVAGLAWDRLELLRVHVPPPLLTELALATGDDALVSRVIRPLPDGRRWVRRVAERVPLDSASPPVRHARTVLETLPRPPGFELHIDVLGRTALRRGDGTVIDGWDRRARVRELLGLLVVHRDVDRASLAAEMWPDLDADKAAANLRVNLHHLNQAIQPHRAADEPTWFVRVDGTRLCLASDGVIVDADRFEEALEHAERVEAEGRTTQALQRYLDAVELYGGDVLPEVESDAVEHERQRLRAAAHRAMVRCGELVLARGEPEDAMRHAVRAQRLDPLSERAQRLFVRCHLALGSTSVARIAAARLRSDLVRMNLRPEPESERLFAQLRI